MKQQKTGKAEGEKFIEARQGLELSRKALGEMLGVSITTIYCWETGRTAIPRMAWLALAAIKTELKK